MSLPKRSALPSLGSSLPTGSPPSSLVSSIRDWSNEVSAPPVTRPSTPTIGAAFRTRNSWERSTRALPAFLGIERRESAVGDIFKWWIEVVLGGAAALHAELTAEAAKQRPGQSGVLGLDWNNGNRTILVDQRLTGLLLRSDLYTTRADIFCALIEATAFGARALIGLPRQY